MSAVPHPNDHGIEVPAYILDLRTNPVFVTEALENCDLSAIARAFLADDPIAMQRQMTAIVDAYLDERQDECIEADDPQRAFRDLDDAFGESLKAIPAPLPFSMAEQVNSMLAGLRVAK